MYEIITQLPYNGFHVKGTLTLPVKAKSLIIFSHGFSNNKLNPLMSKMARSFQQEGFGTLIFNLLDEQNQLPIEHKEIIHLSRGLLTSTNWLRSHSQYRSLDLAYFGSGSGAATAIKTTSHSNSIVKTVVSLSGRLDLIKEDLKNVSCATLLIVGELDFRVVKINKQALKHLDVQKQLAVVPGASHLFEEPGKIKKAAQIATSWFRKQLSHIQDLEYRI
jgi:pimeloyl-ACP methyl ester carboxylesterase